MFIDSRRHQSGCAVFGHQDYREIHVVTIELSHDLLETEHFGVLDNNHINQFTGVYQLHECGNMADYDGLYVLVEMA